MSDGKCSKCGRELREWPLDRGAKCAPKDWVYCIRQEEKLTDRPRIDRMVTRQPAKQYTGEGIGPGAWVQFSYTRRVWGGTQYEIRRFEGPGQVWAIASGGRNPEFWVADGEHFHRLDARALTLLGQASDEQLTFDDEVAS
jgi:hypothetical protein